MCQDSSCSSSLGHCSSFVGVLVSVFPNVGIPWRLSPLPCPSLSFHYFISVTGACFLPLRGGSWLGCLNLPAMGAVSIWELAANSGSSWMSQAPNLHFARQLLKTILRRLKPVSTLSTNCAICFVQRQSYGATMKHP